MIRVLCRLLGGHFWGIGGWDRRSDVDPSGAAAVTIRRCRYCSAIRTEPSLMFDYSPEGFVNEVTQPGERAG